MTTRCAWYSYPALLLAICADVNANCAWQTRTTPSRPTLRLTWDAPLRGLQTRSAGHHHQVARVQPALDLHPVRGFHAYVDLAHLHVVVLRDHHHPSGRIHRG